MERWRGRSDGTARAGDGASSLIGNRAAWRVSTSPPRTGRNRSGRAFRYLTVPKGDRERPFLAREMVRCGKLRCRCAHGLKHGPYFYLRYQQYDPVSGGSHFRREYVPRSEVPRVRRWIRRDRAEVAYGRAIIGLLRQAYTRRRAQPPPSQGGDTQTVTSTLRLGSTAAVSRYPCSTLRRPNTWYAKPSAVSS